MGLHAPFRSFARPNSERPQVGEKPSSAFCPVGDRRTSGFGNITEPGVREPMAGLIKKSWTESLALPQSWSAYGRIQRAQEQQQRGSQYCSRLERAQVQHGRRRQHSLGADAQQFNTVGGNTTAVGSDMLEKNTTGIQNTAVGSGAVQSTTIAGGNTATGSFAL